MHVLTGCPLVGGTSINTRCPLGHNKTGDQQTKENYLAKLNEGFHTTARKKEGWLTAQVCQQVMSKTDLHVHLLVLGGNAGQAGAVRL